MDSENVIQTLDKKERVWTAGQVFFVSLLAGPLGGGYLVHQNANLFGNTALAKTFLRWGVICSALIPLVMILLGLFFPLEKIPPPIIPVAIAAVFQQITYTYQQHDIKEFLKSGKKRFSHFWALFCGLLLCAIYLVFCFVISILLCYLLELCGVQL